MLSRPRLHGLGCARDDVLLTAKHRLQACRLLNVTSGSLTSPSTASIERGKCLTGYISKSNFSNRDALASTSDLASSKLDELRSAKNPILRQLYTGRETTPLPNQIPSLGIKLTSERSTNCSRLVPGFARLTSINSIISLPTGAALVGLAFYDALPKNGNKIIMASDASPLGDFSRPPFSPHDNHRRGSPSFGSKLNPMPVTR